MRASEPARNRRGSLTVEALLLLPIVMLILGAFIELSLTISAEQRLHEASLEGVRAASRGGNRQDVEQAVRRVLGEGRLASARVEARLEDEQGNPLDAGTSVVVTVSICAKHAVPCTLGFVGPRDLVGRAEMRKQ